MLPPGLLTVGDTPASYSSRIPHTTTAISVQFEEVPVECWPLNAYELPEQLRLACPCAELLIASALAEYAVSPPLAEESENRR